MLLGPLELFVVHELICIQSLNDLYNNVSRLSICIWKNAIFLYTGKNIQALDFDNWYPLKQNLDFQIFVIKKAFSVVNGLDLMNI